MCDFIHFTIFRYYRQVLEFLRLYNFTMASGRPWGPAPPAPMSSFSDVVRCLLVLGAFHLDFPLLR